MLNLHSVIQFGKYKGLKIGEILNESRGFEWMLWAINSVDMFDVEPQLEKYIKKTLKLREQDRKFNPQNYLQEKTLAELKAIAKALNVMPANKRKKSDYIEAIKEVANASKL